MEKKFSDSLIVDFEQRKQLQKWYFEGKKEPVLLYRGSRDGFGASDFHKKCDEKGPTLVIVKTTKGNIFGGMTFANWESITDGKHSGDENATIFSLKGPWDEPRQF